MAYEIIQFVNKVGASSRQKGFKITDELVVGYPSVYGSLEDSRWKVYSISSGRPVVDLTFTSKEDAVEFAKWIDRMYGEPYSPGGIPKDRYPSGLHVDSERWDQDEDSIGYFNS